MDIEGKNRITGRFAPSPSGRMHVGNLLSACWRGFRARGGGPHGPAHGGPRPGPHLAGAGGPIGGRPALFGVRLGRGRLGGGTERAVLPERRTGLYAEALAQLEKQGLLYPCFCTRAQLHAAEAPHNSDGETIYSGRCRGLTTEQIEAQARLRAPAVRLRLPDETVRFVDGHYGPVEQNLARECGDIILRRSDGVFAYQLAVVLDDAAMGVTQVVRGRDLLSSTPRQMYLYRLFGASPPQYIHVPLLLARMGGGFPSGSTTWTWALCGRTGFPARRSWAGWPILRASPPSASRPPARPAPPVFLGKGAEGKPGAPGGPVPGRPIGLGPVCRPGRAAERG